MLAVDADEITNFADSMDCETLRRGGWPDLKSEVDFKSAKSGPESASDAGANPRRHAVHTSLQHTILAGARDLDRLQG